MNQLATTSETALSKLVLKGDMSSLTPDEKSRYYVDVCNSVGLNPSTQPFAYLKLQGREILYATKSAADQLRKVHGVSIRIADQTMDNGLFMVRVQATDRSGRADEDMGCVQIGNLQGEAKANAIHKAITKAKRRVTLSICGLGMMDESEIDGARAYDQASDKPVAKTLDDVFGPPTLKVVPEPIKEEPFKFVIPADVAKTEGNLEIICNTSEEFVDAIIQSWRDILGGELTPREKMHAAAEVKRANHDNYARTAAPHAERFEDAYSRLLKKLGSQLPKGEK